MTIVIKIRLSEDDSDQIASVGEDRDEIRIYTVKRPWADGSGYSIKDNKGKCHELYRISAGWILTGCKGGDHRLSFSDVGIGEES
jgi:hypothetical protein